MDRVSLKDPLGSYHPRLVRFLELMVRVRALAPGDVHLWAVMDSVAFQDTETALHTALYNAQTHEISHETGERHKRR